MKGHHGVQEPVDGQALRLGVDTQVAREEQVGLSRLDGDARGETPAVQIPGALEHIVLRHDPSGAHGLGLCLDLQDAVDEHERLIG